MKVLKEIVYVLWPIIYAQLYKLAQRTDTPWDNFAVKAANTLIKEWLDFDADNEEDLNLN